MLDPRKRFNLERISEKFDLKRRLDPATRAGSMFRRLYEAMPVLAVVFLLLVILVLVSLVGAKKERVEKERLEALKSDRPAVNVIVQRMVPAPISDRLDLPAIVEPWEELMVKAEVSGKVTALKVSEGDTVKKGDLLALIDPRDYENALKSAKASYTLAHQTFNRAEKLHKQGITPKREYDSAVAGEESALAALQSARLKLERTAIKAPLSGIINRLDAKVGLLMNVDDPVAEIIQLNPLKVSVGIPESDVSETRLLKSFALTVEALGGRELTGTLRFLSKKPGTLAHLYELELEVPNPGGEVLPGMFARVDVVKRTVEDALSVPIYAVITQGGQQVVYVEKDGVASKRAVTIGILERWSVQVTQGLEPGDRVIVVGHRSVGEGQPLNVIREITRPEELLR